jgi:hypothetical protein
MLTSSNACHTGHNLSLKLPLTRDVQRWLDAELAKIETGPGLHPRW